MVVAAELAALDYVFDAVFTTDTGEMQVEGVDIVLEVITLRHVPGVVISFSAYAHRVILLDKSSVKAAWFRNVPSARGPGRRGLV